MTGDRRASGSSGGGAHSCWWPQSPQRWSSPQGSSPSTPQASPGVQAPRDSSSSSSASAWSCQRDQ
eukprot:11711892-Alexandrium_andersonii.AAC.1